MEPKMKLSKQTEKEVLQVYDTWLQSYLHGDVATYDSYFDDEYHFIGSTGNEEFLSRKDTTKFFENTAEQLAGKCDLRKETRILEQFGGLVFLTHVFDAWFLMDTGYSYYGRFRFTNILHKNKDGWRFIYQHFSTPDSKTEEGETIGFDKVHAENQELREAIKRRTIELERKNRELEIENALEKVRAIALSMQQPGDMVDVCRIISEQLQLLGVKDIRNVQTAIIDDEKGTYLNYQYFAPYRKGMVEESEYRNNPHPTVLAMVREMKKSADAFFTGSIQGKVLEAFREFRKKNNQFPDPLLDEAKSVNYYFYSIGQGGLGLTTYQPLPDSAHEIFKRFHNVFKLAYRRFIDIENAQAQAREAKIEAALERVRSLALGMRKSEDVGNVTDLLFKELTGLSVDVNGCSIIVIDEESDKMELWRARSNVAVKPFQRTSLTEAMRTVKKYMPDFFPKFSNALNKRTNYLVDELSGKRRLQFINAVTEQYNYSSSEKSKLIKNTPEIMTAHYVFFKLGYLALLSEKKLSDENLSIARRFIEVFDFAYTRFLDIKKAEEQAREAQIEAALERVRSKAMGMQKPDELVDVAILLRKEMGLLGVEELETSSIYLHDDETGKTECWFSIQDRHDENKLISDHMTIDLNDTWVGRQMLSFYNSGNKTTSIVMQGANRTEWITYCAEKSQFFTVAGFYGDVIPERTYHLYKFNRGYMGAAAPGDISAESWDLLKRATAVFSLAYTRFSDLKNAEAQAREAQIEAALERTRTQSIMMQHSSEVNDISKIFHEQLLLLGIPSEFSYVWLPNEENNDHQFWATWSEIKDGETISHSKAYTYPLDKTETYTAACFAMWESGQTVHVNRILPEEVADFFSTWAELVGEAESLKAELFPDGLFYAEAYMKYGCFGINIRRQLSEEEQEVLRRFSIEFERAYTRFLDLQKAEAQNKIIQAENQRKTQELEEARQLQLAMLPKELPDLPELDIAVYMQTATEVGGDYYDFYVGQDGELTVVVGDATGHGMKAGTVVTITKSLFNNLASEPDILHSFSQISRVIKGMEFRQLAMCLLMAKIKDNRLWLASAAMPPALIYRPKTKTVEEIFLPGMPLGTMKNFPYTIKESRLAPGDTILLLSDGLPELTNGNDEMYGYERIKTEFHSVGGKAPEEIVSHFKHSASGWVNGNDPDDDVTFVVLKFK